MCCFTRPLTLRKLQNEAMADWSECFNQLRWHCCLTWAVVSTCLRCLWRVLQCPGLTSRHQQRRRRRCQHLHGCFPWLLVNEAFALSPGWPAWYFTLLGTAKLLDLAWSVVVTSKKFVFVFSFVFEPVELSKRFFSKPLHKTSKSSSMRNVSLFRLDRQVDEGTIWVFQPSMIHISNSDWRTT